MSSEESAEFEDAIQRSLKQTTIQESDLADALAESLLTHDGEKLRNEFQDELDLIEHDLMSIQLYGDEGDGQQLERALNCPESLFVTTEDGEREGMPVSEDLSDDLSRGSDDREDEHGADSQLSQDTDEEPGLFLPHGKGRLMTEVEYRPPNMYSTGSTTQLHGKGASASSMRKSAAPSASKTASSVPIYRPPQSTSPGTGQSTDAMDSTNEPLVVIDGQNVGCSYGGGGWNRFRAKGVEVVLEYYFNRGLPAVAMLPQNKIDMRPINDRVADDPELLKRLQDLGRLAFTPAGAHDDHFLLSYALSKRIDIVSNDRFQKEVSEQEAEADEKQLTEFLGEHLIPYTFVHGEFVPNPKRSQLGRSIHNSRTRK